MSRSRRGAALLLVMTLAGAPASAQSCVGDCTGRGSVLISDLILAVNIALERASLDQCPSLGPAPVTVSRLISSVNNALRGCPATPAATATETASVPVATATESATPTITPTPIVSVWVEDLYDIGPEHDCPPFLVGALQQALRRESMTFIVRQYGDVVLLETERHDMVPATLDSDGTLHSTVTITDDAFDCDFILTLQSSVNIDMSPSMSFADVHLIVLPCTSIGAVDCMGTLTTRWTRQEATPTVTATGTETATATPTGTLE